MTFQFDGEEVSFRPGQSVQGALVAHGVLATRTTRLAGAPRGMFCGIGVCFDCLAKVDGEPDQRTCMTPAEDGMVVCAQEGTGRDDLAI
ncbi:MULTISPECIES: (2Fe-2S)-binding protein [Microbacterium]|uniref:(2Fe-2S)-binding protein n=1 Tax=Microbacterium TaxID=33882 RepID=UPI000D64EFCE|nr:MULTISPECIES: (2Fe-2S)-binding protein [Microbacterium]